MQGMEYNQNQQTPPNGIEFKQNLQTLAKLMKFKQNRKCRSHPASIQPASSQHPARSSQHPTMHNKLCYLSL
jgi:hypothetical protein